MTKQERCKIKLCLVYIKHVACDGGPHGFGLSGYVRCATGVDVHEWYAVMSGIFALRQLSIVEKNTLVLFQVGACG